ncbi:MAG: hypothetical protein ACYSU7_07715 [Planctomycetota bacterium]
MIAGIEFLSLHGEPNDNLGLDDFYFGDMISAPGALKFFSLAGLTGTGRHRK